MVVGNFVDGDSRVQKTARSVAAAGWDVVLLGRARGSTREEYLIGDARVIRVPLRMTAHTYRKDHPPRGVAGRFGYRSGEQARMRVDTRRALRADLEVERRLAARDGADLAAKLRLTGLTAADRARGYWIEARRRLYERAAAKARKPALRTRLAAGFGRDGGAWLTQPQLVDFDAAFTPVITELQPDLLHAHDFDTIGLVVRAALKLRAAGHPVQVVYDAHEYIAGWERAGDPAFRPAMAAQERKYIKLADGVVTVSEAIADLLAADHRLPVRPAVVRNAPTVAELGAGDGPDVPDVRAAAGLGPDVPLLVYAGMTAPERGLDTAVAALPALPGVHLAAVTARNSYVIALERRAEALGVADRLHVLPYVEPQQVVRHLAAATAGIVPLLHAPNHELSLPTKYYEYMNARLPLVVSDVRQVAAFTREHGIGEVYPAGDSAAFAAAVRKVLDDREQYCKPYDGDLLGRHTWEAQVPELLGLYGRLVG
ncbi:glycosyltransferase family 4 protein [Yinghuangia soli]|uniref:D-inositol 3-phosphate glycosyltransferase n=1 Tax=Yinghuangia soli TaxID=2908204 RepID=A0AA41Q8H0_9ACTN|nr:glycosyltransferase family 4 protein [Yinghuangia soli]MCF2532671.1 glycosyltransferase family 4 protein [Yinghuangia soli]